MTDRFSRHANLTCPECNAVQPVRSRGKTGPRFRSGATEVACPGCGRTTVLAYTKGFASEVMTGLVLIGVITAIAFVSILPTVNVAEGNTLYLYLGALFFGLIEMSKWVQTSIIKTMRKVELR